MFIRELEKHRVNSVTDIAKKRQEAESAVSIHKNTAFTIYLSVHHKREGREIVS